VFVRLISTSREKRTAIGQHLFELRRLTRHLSVRVRVRAATSGGGVRSPASDGLQASRSIITNLSWLSRSRSHGASRFRNPDDTPRRRNSSGSGNNNGSADDLS
jgi:hypothetical protein